MGVAQDVQALLQEISKLQQSGYVLKAGETWMQAAARSLSGVSAVSRVGQVASRISGLSSDLLRSFKTDLILGGLAVGGEAIIQRSISEGRLDLNPIPQWLEPTIASAVRAGSEAIGAPLFDLLIKDPLGLDLSATGTGDDAAAVRVLQRLFGFGVMVDFGTSELHDLLKMTLGANAPTGLLNAVKNIPQSVGVNWAVGFLLSQLVWTAYMPPMVEQANLQTRPARLSPVQLITLEQREQIGAAESTDEMRRAGYRDVDIEHLRQLSTGRLSLSDLQQAFLFELRDESFVRTYLKRSGISDEDTDLMVQLYLTRAETAGGDQLRAVAQRGFLDGHLTEDDYYSILRSVNVPTVSANLEVEAAKLAKSWQVKTLSVAEVKRLHDANLINDAQAQQRLINLGYSEDDAVALVNSWKPAANAAHPGLTETKILAYLISGVLSPEEAYDRLIALNIKADDASFLVQHPSTAGVTKAHGPSEGLVISAYIDGVIDVTEATARLKSQNLSDDAVNLAIREANFQIVRGKSPRAPVKHLSDAQILDAFRNGLATSAWASRQLVQAGYSDSDALLIVAIEETKLDVNGNPPDGWTVLQ